MNLKLIIIAVVALACGLGLLLAARSWRSSLNARDAAMSQLQLTVAEAESILRLRQEKEVVAVAERPAQDVIASVNAALATAGLPLDRFVDLKPEADIALPKQSPDQRIIYRSQSLSLSLQQMTVAEFGRFLAAWQELTDGWTITRIVMNHGRGRAEDADRFEVNLLLTAIYLGESE